VSYLLAFLGIAALIILHELGHFTAAKAVGMRVERFSLFFGPMFLKRKIGETEYGVGVIPLGGYVKITGMSPDEVYESPEIERRGYYNQPVWKRIVVIGAGPLVNIAVAFLIFWVLWLGNGQAVVSNSVAGVIHPSAAASVLRPGDKIVSVDGVRGGPDKLRAQIDSHRCRGPQVNGCHAQTPVTMLVRRDGVLHTFRITPRYSAADRRQLVGFQFGTKSVPVGAGQAASLTVTGLWNVTTETVSRIGRLFEPKERRQLHGIVGAYEETQKSISSSTTTALEILALISLSLGVVNLFPFLPLDGGHIFWAIAEKLRGRRIPFVVMERAGFVGFALILLLFAIGLTNDISTLSGQGFNVP
jgi:regulator of sigma E protease